MQEIHAGKKLGLIYLKSTVSSININSTFCVVAASIDSAEEHKKWSGFIESKLRQLVLKLEVAEGVEIAHPYVKDFQIHFILDDKNAEDIINSYGTLSGEDFLRTLHLSDSDKDDEELKNTFD